VKHMSGAAAAAIGLILCSTAAFAQSAPASCVTALSAKYGSTPALKMECANETDCTFQAPPANASALALIGSMVKTLEACFTAAGLSMVKEDTVPEGTTRLYGKSSGAEQCAVLIHTGPTNIADAVRATCQLATTK
jgi:hypothetical protein